MEEALLSWLVEAVDVAVNWYGREVDGELQRREETGKSVFLMRLTRDSGLISKPRSKSRKVSFCFFLVRFINYHRKPSQRFLHVKKL